jgi:hypothetical protein
MGQEDPTLECITKKTCLAGMSLHRQEKSRSEYDHLKDKGWKNSFTETVWSIIPSHALRSNGWFASNAICSSAQGGQIKICPDCCDFLPSSCLIETCCWSDDFFCDLHSKSAQEIKAELLATRGFTVVDLIVYQAESP